MNRNILEVILAVLGVKHTSDYTGRLFWTNPDRDNFFGLSYMLSLYGVEGKGYQIEGKDVSQLEKPFVAQTDKGFVVVTDQKDGNVCYQDENGRHAVAESAFLESWSGNILTVRKNEDSCEPDYGRNRKAMRAREAKRLLAVLSCRSTVYTGRAEYRTSPA